MWYVWPVCVDEGGGGGSAIFRLFLPLKRVIRESGWYSAVQCDGARMKQTIVYDAPPQEQFSTERELETSHKIVSHHRYNNTHQPILC